MRRTARGTVLLVVLVVLVALSLLGAAIMNFSGKGLANARHREASVALANCAHAVRQYIAARVTSGTALDTLSFTIAGTTNSISLKGGHYDAINTALAGFNLNGPPGGWGTASAPTVENLTNALPMAISTSGVTHSGSAVCTDADGRQYEVEFSFVSSS